MHARRTRILAIGALGLVLAVTGTATLGSTPVARAGTTGAERPAPGIVTEPSRGQAAGPGQLTVTLALTPGDRAGLDVLAHRGPQRGATRASLAAAVARTAPPAATRTRLARDLRGLGLVVDDDTWSLQVTGPERQLASAFGVVVHREDGRLVPDHEPAPPAGVTAVLGLDERPLVHRLSVPGYNPVDIRSAYAVDRPQSDGAGTTVATVQFSGWDASSLATFAGLVGESLAPAQYTSVPVLGADPTAVDNGGDVEVALDQEAILGAAPAATQRAYFGTNSAQGVLGVYNAIASDVSVQGIDATSNSWGSCEQQTSSAIRSALSDSIARAVAAGSTFFAASGDNGAYDCSSSGAVDNRIAVDFPASLSTTVAVGGTTLNRSGSGFTETAWNQPTGNTGATEYSGSGTGGGSSVYYARPSYQSSLTAGGNGQPAQSGTTRLLPDVSEVADPRTGVGAYLARIGQFTVGGTSASSPLFAGQLAAALSSLGCSAGLGDIHTQLYASTSFTDITTGSNLVDQAGPKYDRATGLGTPVWRALARELEPTAGCAGGTFTPLTPSRILDTRNGTGAPTGKLGAGQTLGLNVLGVGGVPSTGVSAVVINVTVTETADFGLLTVYPSGRNVPDASSVNFAPGQTVANLVVVGVGGDGKVAINNAAGSTHVVGDVTGYYSSSTAPSVGSRYQGLSPSRILDTRTGTGAGQARVGPGGTVALQVTGRGGVPSTGVSAVVLNATVVTPSAATYISVYPSGASRPDASSVNAPAGRNVANAVIVGVGTDGRVVVANDSGSVDLVADVVGYFSASAGRSGLRFAAVTPTRLLDTRSSVGAPGAPITAGSTIGVSVVGTGGIPTEQVASVTMNVTGVTPSQRTYLTVYPSGEPRPDTSSLNVEAGATVPNLQVAKVGIGGRVSIYNDQGSIDVVGDIVGYSFA